MTGYTRDRRGQIWRDCEPVDPHHIHVLIDTEGRWSIDGHPVPLIDPTRQPRLARWAEAGYRR